MKRLKVWQRLGILFFVMLSTNLVSAVLLDSEKAQPIRKIQIERDGLLFLQPLRQLRQWLPVYGALAQSNPKLADPSANAPPAVKIQNAVNELDDLDRRFEHELDTTEDLVGLKKDWAELQKSVSDPNSFRDWYQQTNTRVKAFVAIAGDSSGLILDTSLDGYYLAMALIADLPDEDELLGNVADSIAKDPTRVPILLDALKRNLADTNSHFEIAVHTNPELASLQMTNREHQKTMQGLVNELSSNKSSPAAYAALVESARAENFKFYDAITPVLDQGLQKRAEALVADKDRTIELIFGFSAIALVLAVWIGESIIGPIKRATEILESPDGGKTTLDSTSRDEVSRLLRAATTHRVSPPAANAPGQPGDAALLQENQKLKDLIVELSLENHGSRKAKTTAADSTHS